MAKIVRKLFGSNPERIHVLNEFADFDGRSLAKVSDEIASVFEAVPGYDVLGEAAEEGIELLEAENKGELEAESNGELEDAEVGSEVEDSENTENTENTGDTKPKRLKKAVPK